MSDYNLVLTIPGLPVAKQRHRTSGKRTYNPQSEIERAIQWEIKQQLPPDFQPFSTPLLAAFDAYFPRPASHYGTGRNEGKLKASAPKFHTQTPDHSNIIKFYEDVMNALVFHDDSQIVGFDICGKRWIDRYQPGCVIIRLRELKPVQ